MQRLLGHFFVTDPYTSYFGGSGLVVSAFVSASSGPGSNPSRKHCVVLLGKTLHSLLASLPPRVQESTAEFKFNGEGTLRQINIPYSYLLYAI